MNPFLLRTVAGLSALAVLAQTPPHVRKEDRGVRPQEDPVARQADERRVALIIGNDNYELMPLRNPVKDARALAQTLREANFQVTLLENQAQKQILHALVAFGDDLRRGGVGLFYFSGHGVQINNHNYLLPVGAAFNNPEDIEIEGVDASAVMRRMEGAENQLNIIILDACRNNPFAKGWKRDLSRGLSRMEAPTGALVAYATEPGSTASDGTGDNGLYTKHLIANIRRPGLTLEQVFKRVREGVERESKGDQRPREDSALKGADFFFLPPVVKPPEEKPLPVMAVAPAPAPDALTIELSFWESVRASTLVEDLQAYLDIYPAGRFVVLARNRVRALKAAAQPAPAPPPVSVAKVQPLESRPPDLAPPVKAPPVKPPPVKAPPPGPVPEADAAQPQTPPRPKPKPESSLQPPTGAAVDHPLAHPVSSALPLPATSQAPARPSLDKPVTNVNPSPAPPAQAVKQGPVPDSPVVVKGHEDSIWGVVVAPDGSFIASAGWDKEVRLWTKDGQHLRSLPPHTRFMECLAVSPDSKRVAAGSFKSVLIYDVATGTLVKTLPVGQDWVTAVAFSPQGDALAVGNKDQFMYVIEVASGTLRWKDTPNRNQELSAVAWDPLNQFVLGGDAAGGISVYSPSGTKSYFYAAHANAVTSILFSSKNPRTVFSASKDRSVKAYNLDAHKPAWVNYDFSAGLYALAQESEGKGLLVAGIDRMVHILNPDTGKEKRLLAGHQAAVTSVAYNATNRNVVSVSEDRTLRLWLGD